MYSRADVRMFLFPDKDDVINVIQGFDVMLSTTARWIRQYDPEFVELGTVYEDNDLAICVDWLSLVGDGAVESDTLAIGVMKKLEDHLMEGASDDYDAS